ncbi:MAG: hypothetical protein Q9173_000654 [Seirophora scorigena]
MHLSLLASALILTFPFFPSAHTHGLRVASSKSLSSKVRRDCPLSTASELNRPCPPQETPEDHSYTIQDPDNPKSPPIRFKITVPKSLTVATWDKTLLTNLRNTVPSILQQLKVDPKQIPALTSKGIPLLVEALRAVLSGELLSDAPSHLARRDSLSAIREWIDSVTNNMASSARRLITNTGCFIFSALTIPGFLFADRGFLVLNRGDGEPRTPDQDYFIHPVHDYWLRDHDNVRIYYNANFAPILNIYADGITFGNRIYMKFDRSANSVITPLLGDHLFQARTALLLHEFVHVEQYRDFKDSHPAFGFAYLKGFCQSGFDYMGNELEREAFVKQRWDDKILKDPVGTQFMDKWKLNDWAASLGFPLIERKHDSRLQRATDSAWTYRGAAESLHCAHLKPLLQFAGFPEESDFNVEMNCVQDPLSVTHSRGEGTTVLLAIEILSLYVQELHRAPCEHGTNDTAPAPWNSRYRSR